MSSEHCATPIELGAQWVHGKENNPLFQLSHSLDLLSHDDADVGDEWAGEYRMQDGSLIPNSTIDYVLQHLDSIKQEWSSRRVSRGECDLPNVSASVEDILRESFARIVPLADHDPSLMWAIFEVRCCKKSNNELTMFFPPDQWFLVFERIDNACSDLRELSIRAYIDWQSSASGSLYNFKNGYISVINALIDRLPPETVMLDQTVTKIAATGSGVTVCSKDKVLTADHVIVTVSLGILKANMIEFQPPLPPQQQSLIDSIGFGTINKLFIRFSRRFWNAASSFSLKLVWKKRVPGLPDWVYDISSFDTVRGQPEMLMGWIGGKGAVALESLLESESPAKIGDVCRKVITMFTQRADVPDALHVICTKWNSNPFVGGSYSYPTTTSASLGVPQDHLFSPVLSDGRPVILFAGEHTGQHFYSCANGALLSGATLIMLPISLPN